MPLSRTSTVTVCCDSGVRAGQSCPPHDRGRIPGTVADVTDQSDLPPNPFLAALAELETGPGPAPHTSRRRPVRPTGPVVSPTPDAAKVILDALGLPSAEDHERVCDTAAAVLSERGHDNSVRSYRFGCLVVDGSPASTRRLQHDLQQVEALLSERLGCTAPRLLVRVARPKAG